MMDDVICCVNNICELLLVYKQHQVEQETRLKNVEDRLFRLKQTLETHQTVNLTTTTHDNEIHTADLGNTKKKLINKFAM